MTYSWAPTGHRVRSEWWDRAAHFFNIGGALYLLDQEGFATQYDVTDGVRLLVSPRQYAVY